MVRFGSKDLIRHGVVNVININTYQVPVIDPLIVIRIPDLMRCFNKPPLCILFFSDNFGLAYLQRSRVNQSALK